jgi:hypothetical protein
MKNLYTPNNGERSGRESKIVPLTEQIEEF